MSYFMSHLYFFGFISGAISVLTWLWMTVGYNKESSA